MEKSAPNDTKVAAIALPKPSTLDQFERRGARDTVIALLSSKATCARQSPHAHIGEDVHTDCNHKQNETAVDQGREVDVRTDLVELVGDHTRQRVSLIHQCRRKTEPAAD